LDNHLLQKSNKVRYTKNSQVKRNNVTGRLYCNSLHNSGLVLASGTEETSEASTDTVRVVADSTTRAITSSLVTISSKRISTRGTLLLVAGRTAVTSITQASNMLHGIPGGIVNTSSLAGKMLLRPASSLVITVIGANGTLASSSLVSSEALALTRAAIADSLVGAFSPGMEVVGVDGGTNPSKIKGASTGRAIRASPLILTVKTSEALAVAIHLASSMSRALVLAHASLTVALLGPHILTPGFLNERRGAGRNASGLASRRGRHAGGLTGGFTTGLSRGLASW
jgi:hypothetical protein